MMCCLEWCIIQYIRQALFSFAVLEGSVMYSGGSVAEMVLCDSCENDTCSRNVSDINHVSSGKPFSRSLSTATIVECCFLLAHQFHTCENNGFCLLCIYTWKVLTKSKQVKKACECI